MNLSPVVVTSPAPPPAEGSRSDESTQVGEFSSVLSQQQGQLHERAASPTAPKSAQAAATEQDAAAPDETLALLAAGATLPMMMPRTALTHEPGSLSAQGPRPGGTDALGSVAHARHATIDAAQSMLADAQAIMNTAADQGGKTTGVIPGTDQSTLPAWARLAASTALTPAEQRQAQAALAARPHAAHTTANMPANAALHSARVNPKSESAQAAFAQIAATIGLNTQPVTIAAASTIDSQSVQDAAQAMTSMGQGISTTASTTLLATQPGSPMVATPLSNPAWADAFSRQFVSMTQGRDMSTPHTIELRLDPPSLGPVRITMHISDAVAQAAFVSPHAVVRQAIENALPQLEQQLAQAGISLGQASVNDQASGQSGDQQPASQGSGRQAVFTLDGGTASGTEPLSSAPRLSPRSLDALVDTFA
ncbi:flagellar hook-length control protein FliK [Alcaligenaceae bacterium CGII-47]|nr:flagellar hook-length control protein FliK [Alcaligenaceae bacterium CGII-47]